jgi:hypothetical protein
LRIAVITGACLSICTNRRSICWRCVHRRCVHRLRIHRRCVHRWFGVGGWCISWAAVCGGDLGRMFADYRLACCGLACPLDTSLLATALVGIGATTIECDCANIISTTRRSGRCATRRHGAVHRHEPNQQKESAHKADMQLVWLLICQRTHKHTKEMRTIHACIPILFSLIPNESSWNVGFLSLYFPFCGSIDSLFSCFF